MVCEIGSCNVSVSVSQRVVWCGVVWAVVGRSVGRLVGWLECAGAANVLCLWGN